MTSFVRSGRGRAARTIRARSWLGVLLVGVACGRSDPNGAGALSGVGDGAGFTSPLDKCWDACAERQPFEENDGWCPVEWTSGVECEELCREVLDEWTGAERDAAIRCILTDPLCFQDLETCTCYSVEDVDECGP